MSGLSLVQTAPAWEVAQSEESTEVHYQICPYCGFRLLHVLPPSRRTFPLVIVYCPICGFRRDEHGFKPGRRLSEEERLAALRRWLQHQGLDERILRESYHLELHQFFASKGEGEEEERA